MTEELEQGTEAWRMARAGIATASRFSDVMAKIKSGESASRRNYRTDLVVERLTGRPLDSFTTAAMKQGTEREPLARLAFEAETGMVVREVGFFKHPTIHAGASPDGLIGEKIGLELKCPERSAHLRYLLAGGVPPEYFWQVQGQCWICNLEGVYFASFNPEFPEHLQLVVTYVERDEKAINSLAAEIKTFMAEVIAETDEVNAAHPLIAA